MLSHRFDDALAFAAQTHRTQIRKGSGTPYVAHLMSVCALVLEYGGDEDSAIAALLHDAVEDQGGFEMAHQIEARYGPNVRSIVLECSDRENDTDLPWRTRKEAYLKAIATKSEAAILVTTCDKLHNATSILHDLRSEGLGVYRRFTAGRDEVLWYYRELADALTLRAPYDLAFRLSTTVAQLESETNLKFSSDG